MPAAADDHYWNLLKVTHLNITFKIKQRPYKILFKSRTVKFKPLKASPCGCSLLIPKDNRSLIGDSHVNICRMIFSCDEWALIHCDPNGKFELLWDTTRGKDPPLNEPSSYTEVTTSRTISAKLLQVATTAEERRLFRKIQFINYFTFSKNIQNVQVLSNTW